MTQGSVNLVIALRCEAQPLVDHYALTEVSSGKQTSRRLSTPSRAKRRNPFCVFTGDGLRIIVSGIGKAAAAGAAGYLFHFAGNQRDDAWLNLGIAGHADLPTGTIRVAHKITDWSSRETWYPPQVLDLLCESAEVICVDTPETEFCCSGLYEMESAGFLSMVTRFSTSELIHVVKVVSDNRASPAEQVGRQQVQKSIAAQLDCIVHIIDQLRYLAGEQQASQFSPPEFDEFLRRWHFTTTQSHQLHGILRRWSALCHEKSALAAVSEMDTSRAVLRELAACVDQFDVQL